MRGQRFINWHKIMIRYRLDFTINGFYRTQYFETKQKAETFAIQDGVVIKHKPRRVELAYHHFASRRGYICKGGEWDEVYAGRFGEGIIRHKQNATAGSPHDSNNYHYVEYYIEKK